MRSSAARFHEHLAERIRKLGFTPSKADPDLYIRDRGDYHKMLATYVDDLLIWSKDPMSIIEVLKREYTLKGVGKPKYYLGGNVEHPIDGYWDKLGINTALSAKTYIKNAVERFERLFEREFSEENLPMSTGDHPELDDSPLCTYTTMYDKVDNELGCRKDKVPL